MCKATCPGFLSSMNGMEHMRVVAVVDTTVWLVLIVVDQVNTQRIVEGNSQGLDKLTSASWSGLRFVIDSSFQYEHSQDAGNPE